MTEEKQKEQKEQTPPLCDLLIKFGRSHAQEKGMSLPELLGHFDIASRFIFDDQMKAQAALLAQQAQNQPDVPSEGGDTEEPVAFSPDASEDKDES